jgi:hypothetical protein
VLDKNQSNGERIVEQFGTILLGDARLRTMVRGPEGEAKIDTIQPRRAESPRKRRVHGKRVRSAERKGKPKRPEN